VILQRVLWLVAAVAAIAAAAAIAVIALALAFMALVQPYLGRAGAAGALALLCALAIGLAGIAAARRARGPNRPRADKDADREAFNLTQRLMDLIRDKPFAAAGVAAAVGLIAIRNPRVIGAVLGAFLEGWRGAGARKPK